MMEELLMIVEYTGRQTVVTAKLKAQAESWLVRVEKVANRCTSAHVILTEDKYRKIAEVTVQCRGEQLVATSEAAEMETRSARCPPESGATSHQTQGEIHNGQGPIPSPFRPKLHKSAGSPSRNRHTRLL